MKTLHGKTVSFIGDLILQVRSTYGLGADVLISVFSRPYSIRIAAKMLISYKMTSGTITVSGATMGSETGVMISANANKMKYAIFLCLRRMVELRIRSRTRMTSTVGN